MKFWLNGKIAEDEEARIDPRDRGFLLGDGVFDTLGVFNGRAFRMVEHIARLRKNAALIGLKIPFDDAVLSDAVLQIIRLELASGTGAVRITVSRGQGVRGLSPPPQCQPTVLISASSAAVAGTAAKIIVSTIRRNEGSPVSRIKSLNYLDNILARREAETSGADEALMLNNKGLAACVTAGNIFLVRQKSLFTPRLEDGVLDGIVRRAVLEIAQENKIAAHETSLTLESFLDADEIFITNSLSGIRPVSHFDGQLLPAFEPEGLTGCLQKKLRDLMQGQEE